MLKGIDDLGNTLNSANQSTVDFSKTQSNLLNKFKSTADEVSTLNKLYADLKRRKRNKC